MSEDIGTVSRRTVVRAVGTTAALPFVGTATADEDDRRADRFRCPDATVHPETRRCEGTEMEGCTGDHPATEELQTSVAETIEQEYPTVGALIDAGFKPYFDTVVGEEYAHWLSPEYIGDDAVLDPDRPESILVDVNQWRPIGVMFVATRDGEPIEEPPAVYDDEQRCSPWHYHVGLPGRFAWWYYRQVYEDAYRSGELLFPCRTPCMMHVWTYPGDEAIYAHEKPPREEYGPPEDGAGFETDAQPGDDELDWDVLPDDVVPETKPRELFDRVTDR
ncbi:hypothetical protein [Natrialbaceae archaeon AArc-T1-2]|uniref:hypothetical protein n=1 Tax=Natrialbaceae archaeon AArc-T1-2 TaxID=3053904 RepID=UPI00255AA9DC|nr:hypothetical protein [Natrialbaceae archaeon AArc-T1-2]WIV66228.1 hypothetical protein QQ977_11055 [Natrialbaceae archaeon AArc-T1-2]